MLMFPDASGLFLGCCLTLESGGGSGGYHTCCGHEARAIGFFERRVSEFSAVPTKGRQESFAILSALSS